MRSIIMLLLSTFFVILVTVPAVMCFRGYFEDNQDLVKESDLIQGREHIKLMVVIAGDTIDLKCNVISTKETVITWKTNGEIESKPDTQIVTTQGRKSKREDKFEIANITEEMDGDRVSCEYWNSLSEGRVEAILQVFKLEVETSEEVCDTCQGEVNLVFKKGKRNLGDVNVEERIKTKIAKITKAKAVEIYGDNSEYVVTLPISTAMANQDILAMKPKITKDGFVSDTWEDCSCESGGANVATSLGIAAVAVVILLLVTVVASLIWKKWGGNLRENVSKLGPEEMERKRKLLKTDSEQPQMKI
eukprot:GFUD01011370.1.p1 GENE.GFUD01011370.1~~GFUD01011370.1.p1  ORF type:complete len:304 (-),score=63.32 GFUD01011370.1:319-1230(-)